MATVTDRDRGQLILVGALTLAVSLVAIALVLNSAIYTHNLASRYDSPGDRTVAFARDARLGAGGTIEYANEQYADGGYGSTSTDGTVLGEYADGLAAVETGIASDLAANGRVVRIEHVDGSDTEGVRIADAVAGGSTFKPATTTAAVENDWTVVEDARVRQFRIRVNTSSLPAISDGDAQSLLQDVDSSDTAFAFTVTDASGDERRVAFYDDSGTSSEETAVLVYDPATGSFEKCTANTPTAIVRVTDGTVDRANCRALGFMDELDEPLRVSFYNGDEITGQYELVVDRAVEGPGSEAGPFTDVVDAANYGYHCGNPSVSGDEFTYYPATSDEYPRVSPAIYATEIRTVYDGPEVTYKGTQRVAPGEPGGPAQYPRVTQFDVEENDTDASDGEFVVTWDTTDPNGDAVSVDITFDPAGEPAVTFESESGSGSKTYDVVDASEYDVEITASAGTHSRTVVQRHADDGDDSGCLP